MQHSWTTPPKHQRHCGFWRLWWMWGVCFSICTAFTRPSDWLVAVEKGKTVRDAQQRVTGRIFFICFHVNSRHWARAQWPIPFPREILLSEASVKIVCLDATFYWLPVNECPIRLAVIWEIYISAASCNNKMVLVRGREDDRSVTERRLWSAVRHLDMLFDHSITGISSQGWSLYKEKGFLIYAGQDQQVINNI